MKKKYLLLFIGVFMAVFMAKAQDVSCDELIDYVKKEGRYINSINAIQLLTSDWLREVEAYSINNTIVVIAKIQQNQFTKQKIYFLRYSEIKLG
jgi:ribosome-interacting GTPase 1